MTTPPLAQVPVRSAAELTQRWADLLDPPVFAARSLWLLWLTGDGRSLPLVVPVDDLPAVPDRPTLHTVLDDAIESRWSLHLAAGGRVVPVVEPTTWRPPTG